MTTWNWIGLCLGLAVIVLFAVRFLVWLGFNQATSRTCDLRASRPRRGIELWAAWFWTCDECGQDNFERSVTAEITPEDADKYADKYGTTPEEFLDGQWCTKPTIVTCPHCDAQYLVDQDEEPEDVA